MDNYSIVLIQHNGMDPIKFKEMCWGDIKRIDLGLKIGTSGSSCGHSDGPRVRQNERNFLPS